MIAQYRYHLEKYAGRRTRHTCPGCGKRHEFTRYVDTETGQHLADHVGKCNRMNKCGYHYKPGQYFAEHPGRRGQEADWMQSELWKTAYTPPPAPPVDYLPADVMRATQKHFERNNLCRYLAKLFGWEKAQELAAAYQIGTSKKFTTAGGFAVAFWQIDRAGAIRQCKVMGYDPETGRRIKEPYSQVAFIGKQIAGEAANLAQCFFGEHLLADRPAAPVCIVESEKTALIAAGCLPKYIWLATGGKNGCRWTEKAAYTALEGRKVTLYPDLGAYDLWRENAKHLAAVCDVAVSDLLERKATEEQRREGCDLADLLTMPAASPGAHERPAAGTEQAQGQEAAHSAPQQAQGLPEGITAAGHTLEVDGLPWDWLNEEELADARARIAGHELEVFTAINPAVSELIARLGLEVESYEDVNRKA
jgi:hypothetical protein